MRRGRWISWLVCGLAACAGTADDPDTSTDDPDTPSDAPDPTDSTDVQVERPVDISPVVAEALKGTKLPAMVAVAGDADGVLAHGISGVRSVEVQDPVTWDDRWHLAVSAEAITAVLVATLVEDEVVAWDDTMADLFPELAETLHEDFADVTLTAVLRHHGGITADPIGDAGDWWGEAVAAEKTPRVLRTELAELVLTRAPDEVVGAPAYAGAGYLVVMAALEAKEDKDWEALVQTRVFDALEMDGCGFGPPTPAETEHPSGHRLGPGGAMVAVGDGPGADNPAVFRPAGGVHCTPESWGRFLLAAATRDSVIGEASWAHLQRAHLPNAPEWDALGAGWAVIERPWGGEVLHLFGSNTMWFANAWVAPEAGWYAFTIANGDNGRAFRASDAVIGYLVEHHGPVLEAE